MQRLLTAGRYQCFNKHRCRFMNGASQRAHTREACCSGVRVTGARVIYSVAVCVLRIVKIRCS